MRFVSGIILLLTVGVELISAQKVKCDGSSYKHDASLVSKLKGYFYTVYASIPNLNNEVSRCDQLVKDSIFIITTNDDKCCKSLNLNIAATVKKNRFPYVISTKSDCAERSTENGTLKLIASNADTDGSACLIVWLCRLTRDSFQALCSKNKVSEKQRKWISDEYKKLRLTEHKVLQTADYKAGKCFRKKIEKPKF